MAKSKPFDMEAFLRALADRTRLRILNLMRGDEICVCYFVEVLGETQPKISRHLAYLKNVGVVAARRDGKWMHYRIAPPSDTPAAKMLRDLFEWMDTQRDMQADRARLQKACCSPTTLVNLQGAPKPTRVEARS